MFDPPENVMTRPPKFFHAVVACLVFLFGGATALAQQNFDKVEIKIEKLSATTYVLFGAGGNIGVSVGEDGLFIIDDQYAPLTPKILAALKTISDQPIHRQQRPRATVPAAKSQHQSASATAPAKLR